MRKIFATAVCAFAAIAAPAALAGNGHTNSGGGENITYNPGNGIVVTNHEHFNSQGGCGLC